MRKGKIGVFDSGLGGLLILRAFIKELPQYDYVYLGDTKRVPYGNRSHETIYQFLEEAVDFLFHNGCELIVVACNTASAQALRKIQQEYLPNHYPDKKVLGVIIPTVEITADSRRVGVLATNATVASGTFPRECEKVNPKIKCYQQAAPLLVPLIEEGKIKDALSILKNYLKPLLTIHIDTLILGCTHYGILRREIERMVGKGIAVISQDDILPDKLRTYLFRHPEIEGKLSMKKGRLLLVTDLSVYYQQLAKKWFGDKSRLKLVNLTI